MKFSITSASILVLLSTIIGSFLPTTMADDSTTRILLDTTLTFDGSKDTADLTGSEILHLEEIYKAAFNAISGGGGAGTGTIRSSIMTDYKVETPLHRHHRGLRTGQNDGNDVVADDRNLFKTLDVPRFSIFFFTDFSCLLCWDDDEDRRSLSFGNRNLLVLDGEDETGSFFRGTDKFNTLVCDMLRNGRFETFDDVSNCQVKFFKAV